MRPSVPALLCAVALSGAEPSGYWAFEPPREPAPTQLESAWLRTPLDAFILDKLQAEGLEPSPEASREALLRRVYLDLIGLPPTAEQTREFLEDDSPRAYENLVERLLESPHYGERWALKWLDVVRYADTDGFERDGRRPDAWRFRDYVVRSFNDDKPYARFVQEQIAGDELFPGDPDALIATGFSRLGPRHVVGGNQDKEEARQEILTEMAGGVASAFLGLTMGCARCHDHKFDPILQSDYYSLQAFFAATEIEDLNLASVEKLTAHEQAEQAHQARLKPIQEQLAEIEKPYREQVIARKTAALEPRFRAALDVPDERRSDDQKRLAEEAEGQIKPMWYEVVALIPDDVKQRRAALRRSLHALELEAPDPPAAAFAVRNMAVAPPTHILQIGDYRHKLGEVEPGFLASLGDFGVPVPAGPAGRRAALAKWLTHLDNPLTARVMVNRIWQLRMGSGLAPDPNNFGILGGSPTHPELLDYLTRRFIDFGWRVKPIDRMIVLSSVYRQSAEVDPDKAAVDADNKLYWRADRRRLEAEILRDSILAASGRLNLTLGGKPIRIPIEPEVYDLIFTESEPDNLWPVTPDESEHRRRSLYLLNRRTVRLPFLENFDQPDTMSSCAVRSASTHALQALTLMNSSFMQVESRALAERLREGCGDDRSCIGERLYLLTLARRPSAEEQGLIETFLAGGESELSDLCLAMLNRNEFVYRP